MAVTELVKVTLRCNECQGEVVERPHGLFNKTEKYCEVCERVRNVAIGGDAQRRGDALHAARRFGHEAQDGRLLAGGPAEHVREDDVEVAEEVSLRRKAEPPDVFRGRKRRTHLG